MNIRFAALASFVLLAAFTAASQETHSATRLTNDHYFDFERVSNAQISPDGARIVYTRQQANKIEDRWDSSLWIMNADGSQHRFLTKGSDPHQPAAPCGSTRQAASKAVQKHPAHLADSPALD